MSNKEMKNENSKVGQLASRLAELKLTQSQISSQENTSTRNSISTWLIAMTQNLQCEKVSQTFVPNAAQLAEVERVLVFLAEVDGEPIPSPEDIYQATIACQLHFNWW